MSVASDDAPVSRTVKIVNQRGLHARAAAKFVQCAGQFRAEITVSRDGTTVPGLSIMGLLMLGATPGSTIVVSATGPEADSAVSALSRLIADKFDEDEPRPGPKRPGG